MIQAIIILLILIHFNLFKGWFLALWIIEVVLQVLDLIVKIISKAIDFDWE